MQNPIVSIIINCHNGAMTLAQALQSVLEQSFVHWEIIFWDNSSSDNSYSIAQIFAKNSTQIYCFKSSVHMPLGRARNEALSRARGKYIAFLDCDDLWLPSKLSKQVSLMQDNPKLALVCTNTENFDINGSLGNVFKTVKPQRGALDKTFAALIKDQWVSMSSAMLRRAHLNALRGTGPYFDDNLKICEEAELFYALAYDFEIDYIDEILTKRRIHKHNFTFVNWDILADETEYILQKQCELHKNFAKDFTHIVQILKRRAAFQRAVALWRAKDGAKARKYLLSNKLTLKEYLFYGITFLPSTLFPHITRLYLRFVKRVI